MKAREVLAESLAAQEKEEALLADGERRLAELVLKEKATPSPFAAPPPVGPEVSSELSRMQGIIDNLQRELARLRSVEPLNPTAEDDESMVADLPHKKSRVGPVDAHGNYRNWRTENTIGDHGRTRTGVQRRVAPELRQVLSRYGLRGIRVGEASNPGPNRFDPLRMEEDGTALGSVPVHNRDTRARPGRLVLMGSDSVARDRFCANPARFRIRIGDWVAG